MEKVYFHCAAFDINKLCSLKPDTVNWGTYACWHTAEFECIWNQVVQNVFTQWRYENNLPHYQVPCFVSETATAPTSPPVMIDVNKACSMLAFYGGGKDSLVMLQLLSKANISFSTLTYSHSVYGRAAKQHESSKKTLSLLSPNSSNTLNHRLCMMSDFLDSPVVESLGNALGIKTILAAETPASVFAALPILLHYRYTDIAIAHEHSANTANLLWEATGEEVNHQWGKSKEAELILHSYIQGVLISNVSYFSCLQPIHDTVIFHIAGTRPDAIIHTHSCNVDPPWCMSCPKCCYVWLSLVAYLPLDLISKIFSGHKNLFDVIENLRYFRDMMGLGTNKPFECIGEIGEVNLAFELCRRKGIDGQAMQLYKENILPGMNKMLFTKLVEQYTSVYPLGAHVPAKYRNRLQSLLEEAGKNTKEELLTLLQ